MVDHLCPWCDKRPEGGVEWDDGLQLALCAEHVEFVLTVRRTLDALPAD